MCEDEWLSPMQLNAVMPKLSEAAADELCPLLVHAMVEFGIDTRLRMAAFLAQIAQETDELTVFEDEWMPTKRQRQAEYPGALAATLGNTEPGDGERFKGRGAIRIHGREAYRRMGERLKLDLLAHPERAAQTETAIRVGACQWKHDGLNELADEYLFQSITQRISGGLTGLSERLKYWERARVALGIYHASS